MNSADDINHFLSTLGTPRLSADLICDIELIEKDWYDSPKSMDNDKSLGKDGLAKGFYVIFWDDIKANFISSIREVK